MSLRIPILYREPRDSRKARKCANNHWKISNVAAVTPPWSGLSGGTVIQINPRVIPFLAVALHACGGSSGPRTVSASFTTIYQSDDGTQTSVAGLPPNTPAPTALLYADGGSYTSIPVTVSDGGTFSVPLVPHGTYYLRSDTTSFGETQVLLTPLTADHPDLSAILHGRADAVAPSQSSPVTLNVTGLAPWSTTDSLLLTAAQAQTTESAFLNSPLGSRPPAGATSAQVTLDWQSSIIDGLGLLPDATKRDVTFIYHRTATPLANGGKAAVAARFARLTNFTVPDGGGLTVNVDLQAAPLTSKVATAAQLSKFAALVSEMNPAATTGPVPGINIESAAVSIFSVPGSVDFPNLPSQFNSIGRLAAYDYADMDADADYGTLSYGGFLDPFFKDVRQFTYVVNVPIPPIGNVVSQHFTFGALFLAQEAITGGQANPIAPVIGPVRSPQINGKDAFTAQTGVGLTPVFSWSPPSLGAPTSYSILIQSFAGGPPGFVATTINASVFGATSFTVPPGLLAPGGLYIATITAVQAQQDENRPFRSGYPFYSADAVTNTFTP